MLFVLFVALWFSIFSLLFRVLFCSLSCCLKWILSLIVITLLGRGSWLLCFSFVCGLCTVGHCLSAHPHGAIGRLCSVIVAIPRYLLY